MASDNYVPQVDYTTRDYTAISDELKNLIQYYLPEWTNRDPADFGITLIELFAYMGDQLNFYIDRAANESFLTTASQRKSVLQIANLLSYSPSNSRAASVSLTFSNSTSSQVTIPAGTKVSTTTVVNADNQQIVFEVDSDVVVPAATSITPLIQSTVSATATEGETIDTDPTQVSDGLANQTYQLLQYPVVDRSVSVTIDGTPYNYVVNLIDSAADDPVFSTTFDAYGATFVTFGDNTSGRIPPINSEIIFSYRVGSGNAGNIANGSIKKILDLNVAGITVSQNAAAFGGADQESTDSIRINAPKKISTLNRVVSLKDYRDYAVTNISGVNKANAVSSVYTSVILYCAQESDPGFDAGRASGYTANFDQLILDVAAEFADVTAPNVTITPIPPTYVAIDISVSVVAAANRRQSTVVTAVTAALNNLLTFSNVDFGYSIKQDDVRVAVSQVDGVSGYTITKLARAGSSGVSDVTIAYYEIPKSGTIVLSPSGGIL